MSDVNQQSMMIVSQIHMGEPTFSLIATTESCPYVECIYVPQVKQLAVISKTQKDTFHFFSKLDAKGDVIPAPKRLNGKTHEEERLPIRTFYEYTLTDETEIYDFISLFAINGAGFQIEKYTKK